MQPYTRTWHLKVDIDEVKDLIETNIDRFVCPFSNEESYLNIYKDKECHVKFFNLQECDYSLEPSREGQKYIRYLMKVERATDNTKTHKFLKENFEKFSIETNEANFNLPIGIGKVDQFVKKLESEWNFDASQRHKGKICRARIVELPPGGTMPYHRDETDSNNIRVIAPIVTDEKIQNFFRENGEEVSFHFPATGHFYTFDDKIEHAVVNDSNITRYALIFTVTNIKDMKAWDRAYYRNKRFWAAWGNM